MYKKKDSYWNYFFEKKTLQHNKFCVKGHFFLEDSEWQASVLNTEYVFVLGTRSAGWTQLGPEDTVMYY